MSLIVPPSPFGFVAFLKRLPKLPRTGKKDDEGGDEEAPKKRSRVTKQPLPSVPYQQLTGGIQGGESRQAADKRRAESRKQRKREHDISMEAFAAEQAEAPKAPEGAKPLRRTESRRYDPNEPVWRKRGRRGRQELGDPLPGSEEALEMTPGGAEVEQAPEDLELWEAHPRIQIDPQTRRREAEPPGQARPGVPPRHARGEARAPVPSHLEGSAEPPPEGEALWEVQHRAPQEQFQHGTRDPGLAQFVGGQGEPLDLPEGPGIHEPYEDLAQGGEPAISHPPVEHQGPNQGWAIWNQDTQEWNYEPFKPGEQIFSPYGKLNRSILRELMSLGKIPPGSVDIENFRKGSSFGNTVTLAIPATRGGMNLKKLKTILLGGDSDFPQESLPDVVSAHLTSRGGREVLVVKLPIGSEDEYFHGIAADLESRFSKSKKDPLLHAYYERRLSEGEEGGI